VTPFQVNRIIIISNFAIVKARVVAIKQIVPKMISSIVSTGRFETDKTYLHVLLQSLLLRSCGGNADSYGYLCNGPPNFVRGAWSSKSGRMLKNFCSDVSCTPWNTRSKSSLTLIAETSGGSGEPALRKHAVDMTNHRKPVKAMYGVHPTDSKSRASHTWYSTYSSTISLLESNSETHCRVPYQWIHQWIRKRYCRSIWSIPTNCVVQGCTLWAFA